MYFHGPNSFSSLCPVERDMNQDRLGVLSTKARGDDGTQTRQPQV